MRLPALIRLLTPSNPLVERNAGATIFLPTDAEWYKAAYYDTGSSTICGNGTCESTEDPLSCAADCPDLCGDGLCSGDEDAVSCSADCPDRCGDGLCTGFENTAICWPDCGVCGDNVCDPSEDDVSCALDCAPVCGDGVVEGEEQCEAGVPLAASCTSLGFDAGTLTCNVSTCAYDTSGCFDVSCKPRRSRCSQDSECCSGDCTWLRRCR